MAVPEMYANTPSAGHISWDLFHIQYEGVGYEVPAGSTSDRWVWWEYNDGVAPAIATGALLPATITEDDLVLFGNRNGTPVRIQNSSLVDGELIVDGSIFAQAIAASQISTGHLVTSGIDASVIKFGTMSGERIEAGSIATLQLAAGAVTAETLAAAAVTAEKIAAGAITAESIASGDITATLALLGSLLVGEQDGRRIVMHPQVGFMLVDANDNALVHFPLSSTERNRFTGDVVTEGFTALGNAQFRGFDNEISINSEFKLASGLTRPSHAPIINTSYRAGVPNIQPMLYGDDPTSNEKFAGTSEFHYHPGTDELQTTTSGGGSGFWAGKQHRIQKARLADGVITSTDLFFMTQSGISHTDPAPLLNRSGEYNNPGESIEAAVGANERSDMTAGTVIYPEEHITEPWRKLVDGATTTQTNDGWYIQDNWVQRPAGSKSVTIRFGNPAEVNPSNVDTRPLMSSVHIWHYYADGRRCNNKVEISPDGVTWTTIFDSSIEGTYQEVQAGKVHTFPEQRVMFVRDTLNGNNLNTDNRWQEIKGIGYWPTSTRTSGTPYRPVRIGNYYYIIYGAIVATGIMQNHTEFRIGKFDLNGQQVQIFDYFPHSYETAETRGKYIPIATTDGTDLILAQVRPADGHIRFQHFAVSDAGNIVAPYKTVISTTPYDPKDPTNTYDMQYVSGFVAGTFDLGTYTYFAKHGSGSGDMWAFDENGVRVVENDWGSSYAQEVGWIGDRFILGNTSYSYDGLPLSYTSLSLSEAPIRAAFSWYDSDPEGDTHETDVGPIELSTRKARYGVSISIPVSPPDAGDVNSPSEPRLYVKEGDYTGTDDMDRQTLIESVDTFGNKTWSMGVKDYFPEGPPPSFVNTFPDGIAAQLASQVGGFVVKGDGTGDWPYLRTEIQQGLDASLSQTNLAIADLDTEVSGRLSALENAVDPRPVGEVIMFYGTRSQCPEGFLVMDGATFSSSSYPELATYLGSTTLPNMTDRVAKQPSATEVGGELSGSDAVTLTTAHMAQHSHTMDHDHANASVAMRAAAGASTAPVRGNGTADGSTAVNIPTFTGTTGNAGSATPTPVPIKPKAMALWHAIKAF